MAKVFSTVPPKKCVEVGYSYAYETEPPKAETAIHYVLFGTIANEDKPKRILQHIINAFEERCAGLRKYSEAIERIELSVYADNSESDIVKTYGWTTNVLINISIKQNAKLPKSLKSCAGTNLLYIVGGGHNSGIQIQGDYAALFFGLKKGQFVSGENTFVSDDAFQVVDEMPKGRKVIRDIEKEKAISKKNTPHYAMIYENRKDS